MERKRSSRRYGRGYRQKTLGEKVKDYLRHFIAFMFSNVGIIGLVVGYTITGAFIFMAIEGSEAKRMMTGVVKLRNETAMKLWRLTCCDLHTFNKSLWMANVSQEMAIYQEKIVRAIRDGFDGTDENKAGYHWSFPGAFLYSLTVITTIGYGNVAPKTEWGKMTTILYAIIGMPLFLLYLSNIGDILAKSFKWTYAKCCLCRGCTSRRRALQRLQQQQQMLEMSSVPRPPPWPSQVVDAGQGEPGAGSVASESGSDSGSMSSSEYDPQAVTVPVTLCLAIMVGYVCGGALLFSKYESWNFLDSSYFCFISLSTIGFGDLVPGDKIYASQEIQLSFIFCSMYLMLGMALIAMCFNLMQEEVVAKIRGGIAAVRTACRCRRRQQAEPQEVPEP
ncbi:two pore potassium channel protein sup-9 [Anabrus simplex]|uniref:two pore potassium channel protein sup-9 n=1 Tax=Anabrus simplex TaxID=316456 RepID=UPI0034DD6207